MYVILLSVHDVNWYNGAAIFEKLGMNVQKYETKTINWQTCVGVFGIGEFIRTTALSGLGHSSPAHTEKLKYSTSNLRNLHFLRLKEKPASMRAWKNTVKAFLAFGNRRRRY